LFQVYQGNVRSKVVAVKVIHNQALSEEAYDDFCNEVELLAKLHHPNVIMFLGASFNPLMIVTELMAQGDLEHLLLDQRVKLSLLTRLESVQSHRTQCKQTKYDFYETFQLQLQLQLQPPNSKPPQLQPNQPQTYQSSYLPNSRCL